MTQRTRVYIPDDRFVWVNGEVVSEVDPSVFDVHIIDEDYLRTNQPSSKKVSLKSLKLDSFPLQNEMSSTGVDDMTTLNYLHEASILDNLRIRFNCLKPYTYTGEICIAVNPYQWLDIYSEDARLKYAVSTRHELPPHVYATSASAYRGLRDQDKNQSILVSGESGAGKTETVKILMKHVAQISGKEDDTTIKKILEANPLLESFGNAKTGRNDNSSRFGKFIQLQFDKLSSLVGSKCVTYLLEKTRVISQSDENERNYHIFHEIFAAPSDVKAQLFITDKTCKDFMYTCQGDTHTSVIESITDGDRFIDTMRTLQLIGITAETCSQVNQIIAGIVYLGQISFVGDADSSRLDPTVSEETVSHCCSLLGLDTQAFKERMVVRNIEAGGEMLLRELSRDQAVDMRDALAKDAYARLFSWLVSAINSSIAVDEREGGAAGGGGGNKGEECKRIIGLLDIFGFESFKVNRFEQLCINYTNEKLQQKFTSDVLQNVQEEYRQEGLDWANIEYKDNNDVLELLESKMGFISLLNEECLLPNGNNSNFFSKLTSAFVNKNHLFTLPVKTKDEFCIQHYAGKVSYNVSGFIERNKDALAPEMRSLMLTSSNKLLAEIFVPTVFGAADESSAAAAASSSNLLAGKSGAAGASRGNQQSFMKADTVFTKFKNQLTSLMRMISLTSVNYVRCIKPNSNKDKSEYNRLMVVEQLRCAGIIEAVKVSRAAYPYRIPHREFLQRFSVIQPLSFWKSVRPQQQSQGGVAVPAADQLRQACVSLLTAFAAQLAALPVKSNSAGVKSQKKPYEMGRGKVFFSDGVLELFESLRGRVIGLKATIIGRKYRTVKARRKFLYLRACSIYIQSFYRCSRMRRSFKKILRAAGLLIRNIRRYLAMKLLVRLRRTFRATRIQAYFRMHVLRYALRVAKRGFAVLNSIAKMMTQRRKYITLRDEARESSKMANQLLQLKERLLNEQNQRFLLESEIARQKEESAAFLAKQQQLQQLSSSNDGGGGVTEKETQLQSENEQLKRQIEEMMRTFALGGQIAANGAAPVATVSSTLPVISAVNESQPVQLTSASSSVEAVSAAVPEEVHLNGSPPALRSGKGRASSSPISMTGSTTDDQASELGGPAMVRGNSGNNGAPALDMIPSRSSSLALQSPGRDASTGHVTPSSPFVQYQRGVSENFDQMLVRGREELAAIDHLQNDLSRYRQANEKMELEVMEMKKDLKKAQNYLDIKSGEVAYAKVMLEIAEKERDVFRGENERHSRLVSQYKTEKKHLMDQMLLSATEHEQLQTQLAEMTAERDREIIRRLTIKDKVIQELSSGSLSSSLHDSDLLLQSIMAAFDKEDPALNGVDEVAAAAAAAAAAGNATHSGGIHRILARGSIYSSGIADQHYEYNNSKLYSPDVAQANIKNALKASRARRKRRPRAAYDNESGISSISGTHKSTNSDKPIRSSITSEHGGGIASSTAASSEHHSSPVHPPHLHHPHHRQQRRSSESNAEPLRMESLEQHDRAIRAADAAAAANAAAAAANAGGGTSPTTPSVGGVSPIGTSSASKPRRADKLTFSPAARRSSFKLDETSLGVKAPMLESFIRSQDGQTSQPHTPLARTNTLDFDAIYPTFSRTADEEDDGIELDDLRQLDEIYSNNPKSGTHQYSHSPVGESNGLKKRQSSQQQVLQQQQQQQQQQPQTTPVGGKGASSSSGAAAVGRNSPKLTPKRSNYKNVDEDLLAELSTSSGGGKLRMSGTPLGPIRKSSKDMVSSSSSSANTNVSTPPGAGTTPIDESPAVAVSNILTGFWNSMF